MKKIIIVILLVLLLTGCGSDSDNDAVTINKSVKEEEKAGKTLVEYKKITAEKAKELMVSGNIILDVRTKEEFESGHIKDAVLLPVDQILANSEFKELADKNQIILVYCRSGNRSATASAALIEKGYTKVYDFGGIKDWPYEVVK